MPLNSAEIAAATGQFQQLYSGQNQYSSMIGGMGGLQGPPAVQADQIAGGLMNRAHAIGAPIAGLGMGLLGLDPMSIGLKAGMGAFSSGAGLAGAGIAGLGAAAGVAVPLAIAGYASNQMWQGAQQQQAFNQAMRGAFSFQTPYGQGFQTGQLGTINQQMYSMAGQVGPGGEMTSVRELSQLAVNMGRMGMAGGGTHDVQQFSQRFREMVSTLKVVAKEMGTSLQAAQEFVVAMKGSGIFNSGQQKQLATEISKFAHAGNLATSELTAAASIGAQVSRAIGGRGSQGAFAGVRTLGQIGAAVQSGVLSEEDIYNATGLTGAEGRQALATRQLEQAGGFLRSGRGRMFLASVAGQNGRLDAGSVADWMSGGMGIGETRELAHRNLRRVGKAGFLRNEGRLRGQALEQFGGMLPAMALMQWAGSKGIDINEMDDRSMLFASRQLGMGMDELEDAVKMARNMPRIQEQQRSANEMAQFNQRMATVRRTQGIEGIQRRFEQARDKVQGALQRTGAQFYTDLSNMVERYVNELTGVAVEEYDQHVMDAYHDAMSGAGVGGLNRQLGIGGRPAMRGAGAALGSNFVGGMTSGGVNRFFGRQTDAQRYISIAGSTSISGMTGNLIGKMMRGPSDYDRMAAAGYGSMFRGVSSTEQLQARVNAVQGAYTAAMTANQSDVALGASMRQELRTEYAVGDMQSARGGERVDRLAQILAHKAAAGDKQAAAALNRLVAAESPEERLRVGMQMLTGVETGAGIAKGARTVDVSAPPDVMAALGQGYATQEARDEAYGAAFIGGSDRHQAMMKHSGISRWVNVWATGGLGPVYRGKVRSAVEGFLDRHGGAVGQIVKGALAKTLGKAGQAATDYEQASQIGEYLNSAEGKSLIQGVYAGDPSSRASIEDMLAQPDISPAKRRALKGMLAAASASDLMEHASKEGRQPTEAEWAQLAKQHGMTVDEVKHAAATVGGIAQAQFDTNRRQLIREISKEAIGRSRTLQTAGFAAVDKAGNLTLSADVSGVVSKALGKGSGNVLKAMQTQLDVIQKQSQLGMGATGEQISALAGQYGATEEQFMNMSTADQIKLARALESAGYGDQAAEFRGMAGTKRRIERQLRRGGGVGAAASALGVHLSGADLKGLQNLAGHDQMAAAGQLLSRAGLKGDVLTDEERAQLGHAIGSKDVNALANIAAGKGEIGRKLQGAISEEQKKKTEADQRQQNPLMDKMEKHLDALEKALSQDGPVGQAIIDTSKASKATAANTRSDKDQEKGSNGSSQPNQKS